MPSVGERGGRDGRRARSGDWKEDRLMEEAAPEAEPLEVTGGQLSRGSREKQQVVRRTGSEEHTASRHMC